MGKDDMELHKNTKAILQIVKEVRDLKGQYKNFINDMLSKLGQGDSTVGFKRMVANLEERPDDVEEILIVMHDAIVEHTDIEERDEEKYNEVLETLNEEGEEEGDKEMSTEEIKKLVQGEVEIGEVNGDRTHT